MQIPFVSALLATAALAVPTLATWIPDPPWGHDKLPPSPLSPKFHDLDTFYWDKHWDTDSQFSLYYHSATGSVLTYVNNSDICETTPGVRAYPGYISVAQDQNMFYWFFEARHNPDTAPLAMWLNGGPGCSSMIGLFQENGPCHFEKGASADDEPTLNPYSWNEYANMIYIDQPMGVGFSAGNDNVSSTVSAARGVWKFMQAWYDAFPKYKRRDFGLWTESYGGHYGPEFAAYFEDQNRRIAEGTVKGEKISLVALGINNGWIDAKLQYPAFANFALENNHLPGMTTEKKFKTSMNYFKNMCLPRLDNCPAGGLLGGMNQTEETNQVCRDAEGLCRWGMENVVRAEVSFNVYDVRLPSSMQNVDPPKTYVDYLNRADIREKLAAQKLFEECVLGSRINFSKTGDRARSFLGRLSEVAQSGVNILMWAGDADWICNWVGNLFVADAINSTDAAEFRNATMSNYTVDGEVHGEFKTAGKLNWLRVFDAGHKVPYYQPEVSLQVFKQIMQGKPISSS